MSESSEIIMVLGSYAVEIVMQMVTNVLAIVAYVLTSLSLYTIAKRRGIDKPWLAWIPIGNVWILGSISDQYQQQVKNKETKHRKTLLILECVMTAVIVVSLVVVFVAAFVAAGSAALIPGSDSEIALGMLVLLALVFLPIMVIVAVGIAECIFTYICYYDVFMSCNPDKAVLFLLLSIFISYALPVVLFISRNKDDGIAFPEPLPEALPEQEN